MGKNYSVYLNKDDAGVFDRLERSMSEFVSHALKPYRGNESVLVFCFNRSEKNIEEKLLRGEAGGKSAELTLAWTESMRCLGAELWALSKKTNQVKIGEKCCRVWFPYPLDVDPDPEKENILQKAIVGIQLLVEKNALKERREQEHKKTEEEELLQKEQRVLEMREKLEKFIEEKGSQKLKAVYENALFDTWVWQEMLSREYLGHILAQKFSAFAVRETEIKKSKWNPDKADEGYVIVMAEFMRQAELDLKAMEDISIVSWQACFTSGCAFLHVIATVKYFPLVEIDQTGIKESPTWHVYLFDSQEDGESVMRNE